MIELMMCLNVIDPQVNDISEWGVGVRESGGITGLGTGPFLLLFLKFLGIRSSFDVYEASCIKCTFSEV